MAGVMLGTMQSVEVMLVGSANMDLVVRTDRFPNPGETLTGGVFQTFAGGKGSNQASAVGRLGGKVGLVAKVGQDSLGDQLVSSLAECGVDTKYVLRAHDESTGVALITVDSHGENTIVVAPGTNALLSSSNVREGLSKVECRVLLVQLEIPLESVVSASKFAEGRIFILNPAPARDLPDELLSRVDYLTPNESEAQILTGILPTDDRTCFEAAKVLLARGVKNVIFTLGENGSYLANSGGGQHFPSISIKPVDTTGAGDAFNGALAHFLAQGETIERAIELANIVGALSTTKPGAQASMPTLDEVMSANP